LDIRGPDLTKRDLPTPARFEGPDVAERFHPPRLADKIGGVRCCPVVGSRVNFHVGEASLDQLSLPILLVECVEPFRIASGRIVARYHPIALRLPARDDEADFT